MAWITVPAAYYQQFSADYAREVPAEGFGGWKKASIQIDPAHTAVVLMHAWHTGTQDQYPGWWSAVEYMPRAHQICREVLPGLVAAVREARMPLFHVVSGGDYYKSYPGYQRACRLAEPEPPPAQTQPCEATRRLWRFRTEEVYPGRVNLADIQRGFAAIDFPDEARPEGQEGIAENRSQLLALCREAEVDHLIYAGFAINWCLLLSPGGMADMHRHGLMCSALRQAVTAVENHQTAREQMNKQIALWRVALAFGFVFDVDPFIQAIGAKARTAEAGQAPDASTRAGPET